MHHFGPDQKSQVGALSRSNAIGQRRSPLNWQRAVEQRAPPRVGAIAPENPLERFVMVGLFCSSFSPTAPFLLSSFLSLFPTFASLLCLFAVDPLKFIPNPLNPDGTLLIPPRSDHPLSPFIPPCRPLLRTLFPFLHPSLFLTFASCRRLAST